MCVQVRKELIDMGCYDDFVIKCMGLDYNECRSYILKTSLFKDNENLLTQDIVMHIKHEVSFRMNAENEVETIKQLDETRDIQEIIYKKQQKQTKQMKKFVKKNDFTATTIMEDSEIDEDYLDTGVKQEDVGDDEQNPMYQIQDENENENENKNCLCCLC